MRTFRLNKLVRDGVYEDMLAIGQQPISRVLDGDELIEALTAKLLEEAREFEASDSNSLKEIADLQEVLNELTLALGHSREDVEKVQAARKSEVGGFAGHVFVGELVLEDDDPWAEYYSKQPERFPEIIAE